MTDLSADTRGADLARYYDLDLLDDPGDLDMYLALAAAQDGPILELAAGSGRICVALAAAGHDVTGVDRDPHMLGRARAAWQRHQDHGAPVVAVGTLQLVEHDIADLRLGRRFGLVILALNTLLMLGDRAAQTRALTVMARHLAPKGRALIDVWLPSPDDLALYDGRVVLDWVRHDPDTDEWVAKSSSARYAVTTQVALVTTIFDAWQDGGPVRRTMRSDEICFIGASELRSLAAAAGLTVETSAQDYEMTPLSGDGERVVLVARAGAA